MDVLLATLGIKQVTEVLNQDVKWISINKQNLLFDEQTKQLEIIINPGDALLVDRAINYLGPEKNHQLI